LGVIWVEPGGCTVLRYPIYDSDGDGLAVIYEWKDPVRPTPAPPQKKTAGTGSLSSTLRDFFSNQIQSVKTAATDYIVNPAIQTYDVAHNWIVNNPKTVDTANLGLDLWGVAASGAALLGFGTVTAASGATGVGAPVAAASGTATAASWLALVSSADLVGADGGHLFLELFYGETAAKISRRRSSTTKVKYLFRSFCCSIH
jgi:hypothetical protein